MIDKEKNAKIFIIEKTPNDEQNDKDGNTISNFVVSLFQDR